MTKTSTVLEKIVESVTQAMDMISQIATASEEMSAGAEEISKNVEAISSVTKQSATGSEEMARTAEQMTKQTETLRNLVNQFKLREDSSVNSSSNHYSEKATHNGGMSRVSVGHNGLVKAT